MTKKNLVHEIKVKFKKDFKLPLFVNYKLYGPRPKDNLGRNGIKFLLSVLRYCKALIHYETRPWEFEIGWRVICFPESKKALLQRFGIKINMSEYTILISFCSAAVQLTYSFSKDLYEKLRPIIPFGGFEDREGPLLLEFTSW